MIWALLPAALAGIQGIVFGPDGAPIEGATVEFAGQRGSTDAAGAWALPVDEATADVDLTLPSGERVTVPGVAVRPGWTTEVLVTPGAPPIVQIEAPDAALQRPDLPSGPPGTLTGTLVDQDSGKPLAGVRLFVRGLPIEATTDDKGRFSLSLPEGERQITAIRAGYGALDQTVRIVADDTVALELRMARAGLQLDDLMVRAPRIAGGAASLLDERQEAATVSDVLGAEQMSRAGDSDAASALRRVTGLTVIGGKYVYVRGLGDRYSATLLNGSSLPSPEPEKRVVPLDLFPTSLIEAVVVQKTFSPDRPAEFGGGVVEIRTRSTPEEPVLSVTLSGSYDAGTTLAEADFGDAGPTDWLGFGAGYRALPEEVAAASDSEPLKAGGIFSDGGYTADELERYGELISDRWGLDPRRLPPDLGLSVSAGGRRPAGGVELGALGGLVFSNGWNVDEGYKATYSNSGDGLELKRRTDFVETQNRIRLGGALNLGLESERLRLGSTTLLMRSSAGTALVYHADDPTGSNDSQTTRIDWEETQLLFEQLTCALDLGELELSARAALALARRVQPDKREYTYLDTQEGLVLSQRGSWNELLYGALDDRSADLGLELSRALGSVKLTGGAQGIARARSSTTRRFSYQFQGSEGIDLSAPITEILVDENIGAEDAGDPGFLEIEENTTSSDDYSASQRLQAGFLMGDITWTGRLSTLLGLRVERSTQQVSTFELFDASQTPVEASLTSTDLLPAVTATWGIGPQEEPDQMLVRLGYGRTLSRPELRELSQVAYYDYRSGRLLYGNPELERAAIHNVDARWEWYPRAGESLSLGAFFKRFDHPIESVVAVSAVSGSVGTFDNATSATNLGAETEFRQRLDILHPVLEDVYASANGALVWSRVDLSDTEGNQTSEVRPLQGQSPWVLNAALSYEDPDRRTNVSLLYNVFGPRIVEVGTSGIPDTYEEPVHRLDLVGSQGLGERWTARLKLTNLLDWPARERTGDQVSQETREGWSAGLSLTWAP